MDLHPAGDPALEALWQLAVADGPIPPDGGPEVDVLIRRLLDPGSPDMRIVDAHLSTGAEFLAQGDSGSALCHYRAAFAHMAPAPGPIFHVAALFIATSRHAQAALWLRRIITAGYDNPDSHIHLAHALWGMGEADSALLQAEETVARFSYHSGAIETAALLRRLHGDTSRAVELCMAYVEHFGPQQGVLTQLALATVTRHASPSAAVLSALEAVIPEAVTSDLVDALTLVRTRVETDAIWHKIFDRSAAFENEWHARPEVEQSTKARKSIVMSLADAIHHDTSITVPDAFARDGFSYPIDVESVRHFQNRLLSSGYVELHSPFGGFVRSHRSLILNYHPDQRENGSVLAYYFEDPRPSFALVISEDQWPIAWYDPISDQILRQPNAGGFDLYAQDRVIELKLLLLNDPARSHAYLHAVQADTKVLLLLGMLDYLSTHLFADLQGVQHMISDGLTDRVSKIVVTGKEFFGPVEELFPELGMRIERSRAPDATALNHKLWDENRLIVRVIGSTVSDGTADRVIARATDDSDPTWKAEIDRLSERGTAIFVSLRAHNRRWLASPLEIAEMFNDIARSSGPIALVLDGHAADGAPVPSALAEPESAQIASIKEALAPGIECLVSAGRGMADSIYAAVRCHLHLSAQGTSATKSVLIARKPGVVIGPRQFGWDACGLRQHCGMTIMMHEHADDLVAGDIHTDFHLDATLVRDALTKLITDQREA